MDHRSLLRPGSKPIDRPVHRLGDTPKAPCYSQLPIDPSRPFYHHKTRKSTSAKQTEILRRKSSADVDDLASPQNSSRYLLSDKPFMDYIFDSEKSLVSSQPFKDDNNNNNYKRFNLDGKFPAFRSLSTRSYESPVYKPSYNDGGANKNLPKRLSDHLSVQKSSSNNHQVVDLRVSIHCKGCEGKLRKYISRMEDTNHASIDVITSDSQHKISSLSSSAKAPPTLQFGSLEPAMVKVPLANEGTMREENSNDKFEEEGEWILVTRKRRQRRCIDELHPLFSKKSYSPTVGKPNPVKVLKTPHVNFKKSSKSNHRTLVTLDDFFPKKFFESKEALPLKASTSSHVGENQAKSVVVGHIPQVNPKGKEIVADVHVQPGNTSKIQPKVTRSNDYQVMAQRLIMPITKINSSPPNDSLPAKISCQKLQGTFSPKVYKLLEKSGYDFSNPSGLRKLEPELTGEKIHGLTKAQHKLRKQGYQVDQPKTGLGFALAEPPSDDRVSVFDRLSTPIARPSVFGRLGSSSRIPNVQDRLGASSIP
ncbi:hypothetical protein BUALT_Bualt02G0057400 [Buddleja alternifolia]|uniref:Uncharacterized protein n=1 Tax=Buddleja alternifolia TaxID=168488 RepID=A0AAV6XXP9_9LAMI|nr:hypothetical protein BUALT_Bualt02G0057400 [Buddleja alternifolia]